mmetsp:Transcript_22767/g.52070  ORF Transcript_22767/g.52070 Transcript_22767/m.52070 type:complete len:290 (-) Transcript_22767:135-1004(-)
MVLLGHRDHVLRAGPTRAHIRVGRRIRRELQGWRAEQKRLGIEQREGRELTHRPALYVLRKRTHDEGGRRAGACVLLASIQLVARCTRDGCSRGGGLLLGRTRAWATHISPRPGCAAVYCGSRIVHGPAYAGEERPRRRWHGGPRYPHWRQCAGDSWAVGPSVGRAAGQLTVRAMATHEWREPPPLQLRCATELHESGIRHPSHVAYHWRRVERAAGRLRVAARLTRQQRARTSERHSPPQRSDEHRLGVEGELSPAAQLLPAPKRWEAKPEDAPDEQRHARASSLWVP